jgi:hypothetical protein
MPTTSHLAVTRLNVNNARCFAPSGGKGLPLVSVSSPRAAVPDRAQTAGVLRT